MNIFQRAWQRFNETMPRQAKRFIFAMYATLVFAQTISILPTYVVEKVAIGLIVLHFVMEFCFPNKDDNPPPKAMIWLLLAGSLLLSGCKDSYIKARFGKQAKDSVTIHVAVRDTVTVPKDSIVTVFRTDTTEFHRVYETHRTELIVDRRKGSTSVKAICKPDTIIKTKEVAAKCPPAVVFQTGVSVWYKYGFVLATIGMIVIAAFFLLKMYQVTFTRNDNGIGFKR